MLDDIKVDSNLEVNEEVIKHLMMPQNYGKLEEANGIGLCVDEKSNEYVIFYLLLDDNKNIKDLKFATNGCQDTVVVGSMFTSMIKNENIDYANKAVEKLKDKLGNVSKQQLICINLALDAFASALINYENRKNNQDEQMHILKASSSCEV